MGTKWTVSYENCYNLCMAAFGNDEFCSGPDGPCLKYKTKYGTKRSEPTELEARYDFDRDGIILEGSGCSPVMGQEILNHQFVTGGTNVGEIQAISASKPPLSMLVGSFGGAVTNHFYLPNSECTGSRKTIVYFKGSDANPGPEGPYYNLSCSLTLSGTAMTGGLMLLNPAGTAKELLWTGEYWVSMSCCPGDAR